MSKKLINAWNERKKLFAQWSKLRAEGDKLRAEGDRLWAEGDKLRAEGDRLWAEGCKLRAEGDLSFIRSVIDNLGNVEIEWNNDRTSCTIEGVKYE